MTTHGAHGAGVPPDEERTPPEHPPRNGNPSQRATNSAIYGRQKAELLKRELSNSENFDKSILTYSSAGLAFSLGFLKDFVPIIDAAGGWLLYSSWICFTLAIVLTILSFMASQQAIETQLHLIERYYLHLDEKAFTEKNIFSGVTAWSNRLSGLAFVMAIVSTTIFVSINLERSRDMQKGRTTDGAPVPSIQRIQSVQEQRGAPIPPLQKIPVHQPTQNGNSNSSGPTKGGN